MKPEPGVPFHPLVGELDRRIRLRRLLRDAGPLAGAVALALLVPKLFGDGVPLAVAAVAAAGAAVVGWRFVSSRSLSRAATRGDRAGGLADELGSAQWFVSTGTGADDPWVARQIERARNRAESLDGRALVPVRVGRPAIAQVAALALVAALLPLSDGPLIPDSMRARIAQSLQGFGGGEGDPVADNRTQPEEPDDPRAEARSPEDVVAELRAGELPPPPEEGAGDAESSLAALMEDRAFREMSEDVAAALSGLAGAMDQLESGESLAASEWLADLSEAIRNAGSAEELQALLDSLEAGAEAAGMDAAAAEMMANMEAGLSPEEAFSEMAQNLQTNGGEGTEGAEAANGDAQSMPFPGDGEGGGTPQPGDGGAEPAPGMPQGGGAMSGEVQMVAAEGQMGAPMPLDAGPAGNMTGPGGGGESEVFGAATSLEVQLELEAVPAPLEEEELAPEQIVERQSRREDASVAYDAVAVRSEFADEEASAGDRSIPPGLRPLVRAYFLVIGDLAGEAEGEAEGAGQP